jgi:hypothetical protein
LEDDLEAAHQLSVTFPASFEAIDASFGTERGSPRVVPNETKLAIADGASRGFASEISGAIAHCYLLLV